MLNLSPADVKRRLEEGFRQSARKWVPGKDGDPRALEKVREDFLSSLIEPEEGVVFVEQTLAEVLGSDVFEHWGTTCAA